MKVRSQGWGFSSFPPAPSGLVESMMGCLGSLDMDIMDSRDRLVRCCLGAWAAQSLAEAWETGIFWWKFDGLGLRRIHVEDICGFGRR